MRQRREHPLAQFPPVNALLIRLRRQLLAHADAGVDALLVVRIAGGAEGGDFSDQVGRTFNGVVAGETRALAVVRFEAQQRIRLAFVLEIKPHICAIARVDTWRRRTIDAQPGHGQQLDSAVLAMPDR